MKKICHMSCNGLPQGFSEALAGLDTTLFKGIWWLGKNKFIRFLATDAKTGIGFRMGGIHPTCGRLDRVGVMARKAFSHFAMKGFA